MLNENRHQWQLYGLNILSVAIGVLALLLSAGIQNKTSSIASAIAHSVSPTGLVIVPEPDFDPSSNPPIWTAHDFSFLDDISGKETWAFESQVQSEQNGLSSVAVSPSFFKVRHFTLLNSHGFIEENSVVLGSKLEPLREKSFLSLRNNTFKITDQLQAINDARHLDSEYDSLVFLPLRVFPSAPGAKVWINPPASKLHEVQGVLEAELRSLRQHGLKFKLMSLQQYYMLDVRIGISDSVKQTTKRLGLLLALLATLNLGMSAFLRVQLQAHEFALRRALGSPLRTILWLAVQPFVIAVITGTALAVLLAQAFFTRFPEMFSWGIAGLGPIYFTLLAAICCMLPPLWQTARIQPAQALKGYSFQQSYLMTDFFANLAMVSLIAIVTVMSMDIGSSMAISEQALGGHHPLVFYLRGPQHSEQQLPGFKNPTLEDYQAVLQNFSDTTDVGYLVGIWVKADQMESGDALFAASSANLSEVLGLQLKEGRYFTHDELQNPLQIDLFSQDPHQPVKAVLGSKVAQAYLIGSEGVGSTLEISYNFPITVIGVLDNPELIATDFLSNAVLLPLDIANPAFETLIDDSGTASEIIIRSHIQDVERLREEMTQFMHTRWSDLEPITIRPGASLEATLDFFRKQRIWFIPLISAGILLTGIALSVSGLISVSDRIRYLGLLRAFGASKYGLLKHETLRLFGRIFISSSFGIMLGYLYVILVYSRERFMVFVNGWVLLSAFLVAFLITALFAWIPLRYALHVVPREALRGLE